MPFSCIIALPQRDSATSGPLLPAQTRSSEPPHAPQRSLTEATRIG